MLVAVTEEDPDLRRDAVSRIAQSKQNGKEWAIKGYSTIALLETNSQTRCVAIRALARTGDPRAAEVLLKILNYADQPPEEVRPPDDLCRWDATLGLAGLSAAGQVPAEARDAARDALLNVLKGDTNRNARAAAARGLGYYSSLEVVQALIEALRDADFAVVHECEESLVRLTGSTQNCSAPAWEAWYAANEQDLFAHAGQVPASRRPAQRNGFEKAGEDLRRLWEWTAPATEKRP